MSQAINREGLSALHTYNAYANRLLFGEVCKLTDAQFTQQSSPSHNSIQQLLTHMLQCEAFFLAQCQGKALDVEGMGLSSQDKIRLEWEQIAQEQQNFIAALDDAGLYRPITIHLRGQQFIFPVWQLLTQALIHSIHHRGELSIVLTQLGYPLPTLDILLHFMEQNGQSWPE